MDFFALRNWLTGCALPLWWASGIDRAGWGFHESLDGHGLPMMENRRCRVQARQVFAFTEGARLGWDGDARAAAAIGLKALDDIYRRGDGLYRTLVSPAGAVIDDRAMLYDQAFILLALASVHDLRPESEGEALALLDAVEARARISLRGLAEFEDTEFLANPLMHLFEAAQAWAAVGNSPRWPQLAAEIGDLAIDRLIDWQLGALNENFDQHWRPLSGPQGGLLEPGHQFEWASLLQRWTMTGGNGKAAAAARLLHTAGSRGLIAETDFAADSMDRTLRTATARARLWPQTERLKSASLLAATSDDRALAARYWAEAEAAQQALMGYLATPVAGLWRDKYVAGSGFVDEPSPASTLYHLVSAASQLAALAPDYSAAASR